MSPPSTIDELRAIVHGGCISERDGQLVVSPRTTEEVAAVARHANANRIGIEIVGTGTKRSWGNAFFPNLLVDTTRLTGALQHSWQDLTATVAAGTTWADMERVLAAHNQFVALDPLWPETATVGGILATNDSGALRLRYGSLRDLVIGMTIVLADGTIARSGGKVVKNVAGYDLHKLMIGAFGTLGIITDVTFRLHPISQHDATFSITSPAAEPLGELMLKVLDSHLSTQAMQVRAEASQFSLDVRLGSLPQVLAIQSQRLRELSQSVSSSLAPQPAGSEVFQARQNLFANAGDIILKITVLPSAMAKISADVVRLGGTAVAQATGIMFARFSPATAEQALSALRTSLAELRSSSITILRTPSEVEPFRRDEAPALMHEIKRRFDPNRILNPGRILGGI